jgi:hypothetical protein
VRGAIQTPQVGFTATSNYLSKVTYSVWGGSVYKLASGTTCPVKPPVL